MFAQDQNLSKLLSKCIDYCSKQSIDELKKTMKFDKIAPQNLCNLLEVRYVYFYCIQLVLVKLHLNCVYLTFI